MNPFGAELKRRDLADFTDSEAETASRPLDLESHDPRPESVVMAGWGKECLKVPDFVL